MTGTTDVTVCCRSGGRALVIVCSFSVARFLRGAVSDGRQQHSRSTRPARRLRRSRLSTAGNTSNMAARWNRDSVATWREKMRRAGIGMSAAARNVRSLLSDESSMPGPAFFSSTPICSWKSEITLSYYCNHMHNHFEVILQKECDSL